MLVAVAGNGDAAVATIGGVVQTTVLVVAVTTVLSALGEFVGVVLFVLGVIVICALFMVLVFVVGVFVPVPVTVEAMVNPVKFPGMAIGLYTVDVVSISCCCVGCLHDPVCLVLCASLCMSLGSCS